VSKNKLLSTVIILLLSIAIFSYIATKATVSSFTIDESYTYLHYVHHSFMDILSHKNPYTNNHLLNSLMMKYSEKALGTSEISLRLPNLIMFLVFLIYTFLLFKKSNRILGLSIFVLMITNTCLIDFFGLARGYGLSIGFMVMSLFHLIQSFSGNKNKHLVLFNMSALLSILSNFTLLDFYVASLFVFNLVSFLDCRFTTKEKFVFYKINSTNIILFLILLLVLYEPVRRVIRWNSFDFGGKEGFMSDTVASLLYKTFGVVWLTSNEILFLKAAVLLIVLVPFFIMIRKLYSTPRVFLQYKELIITNLILLSISMEIIMQHYFFKTDYITGRFALFLFPLFIINFGFFLEYILHTVHYQKTVLSVAIILAILSTSLFYKNVNLYSCAEWGFDMETKNVVKVLIEEQKNSKSNNIKLGVNWLFEPTINFYKQSWNLNWLFPVDRRGVKLSDDYFYIFKSDLEQLSPEKYKIIFTSDRAETLLIRNEKKEEMNK